MIRDIWGIRVPSRGALPVCESLVIARDEVSSTEAKLYGGCTFTSALRRIPFGTARGAVALLAASAVAFSAPAYGSTPSGKTLAIRELRYLHAAAPKPPGSRQLTLAAALKTKPFSSARSSPGYPPYQMGSTDYYIASSASNSLAWLEKATLAGHAAIGSVAGATPGSVKTLVYSLPGTKELEHPNVIYVMLVTPKGALEYGVTAAVGWKRK